MNNLKKIRVCIVNKYYPPYHSATGYHANRLAGFLVDEGNIDITVYSQKKDYHNSPHKSSIAVGRFNYVRRLYRGRQKWLRAFSSLIESFLMIMAARRMRADFYIVLTDPSFLNFSAALLLRKKRWALWAMDVYPDAFRARGYISASNPFYKFYHGILDHYPPSLIICLGPGQQRFLQRGLFEHLPTAILPVGLMDEDLSVRGKKPKWKNQDDLIYFGYVGNLGEAHDLGFLKTFINCMDPDRHRFILCTYGVKAQSLIREVVSNPLVVKMDYLDAVSISYLDIQIVSLLDEWTHICVPSKTLSALQSGNAVLFQGSPESDAWQYAQKAGWIMSPSSGAAEIKTFLSGLNHPDIEMKKQVAIMIAEELKDLRHKAYLKIKDVII